MLLYQDGVSGPMAKEVRVAFHFEDWKPDLLQRDDDAGTHKGWRMVPPGQVLFYFIITPFTDEELATRERLRTGASGGAPDDRASSPARSGPARRAGSAGPAPQPAAVCSSDMAKLEIEGAQSGKLRLLPAEHRPQLHNRVNVVTAEPQDHIAGGLSMRVKPRLNADARSVWTVRAGPRCTCRRACGLHTRVCSAPRACLRTTCRTHLRCLTSASRWTGRTARFPGWCAAKRRWWS